MITANWQPSEPTVGFNEWHKNALIFFITGEPPIPPDLVAMVVEKAALISLPANLRMTPIQALNEITRLNDNQLHALEGLYTAGLRGEHLRKWRGRFMHWHRAALAALVLNEGVMPEQALQRIQGLSYDECWNICNPSPSKRSLGGAKRNPE